MTVPEMTDEYDSEGLGLRRRRGQSIPRLRLRGSGCQAARHWPSASESTPGPALTQTSTKLGITPGSSHESSVSCQWTRHQPGAGVTAQSQVTLASRHSLAGC